MQTNANRIVAVILGLILLVGGADMLVQISAMSANLNRMSQRLDALELMDTKLSETNSLLRKTNESLNTMTSESRLANVKLGAMRADLATMSHKISGSFLFRGVK